MITPVADSISVVKAEPVEAPAPPRPLKKLLPGPLHFPLVATLSLAFAALGHAILVPRAGNGFQRIQRPIGTWTDLVIPCGWRTSELALAWYSGFDALDVAALSVLSCGPTLYLLHAFYNIPFTEALLAMSVNVYAAYLPFYFLRPLSVFHDPAKVTGLPKPNKGVITDPVIQVATIAFSAAVYGVTILAAYLTFLPTNLVLYFSGIPSVEAAHPLDKGVQGYLSLLPVALLLGVAAREFIFTPTAAQSATTADERVEKFDPEKADLKETVWWNLWGWHSATKVNVARTATAAVISGGSTLLQCRMAIRGVETTGAVAYASVWAFAVILAGAGMGLIGVGQ